MIKGKKRIQISDFSFNFEGYEVKMRGNIL